MINQYINFVEEWCEVLENKAFARQHGTYSRIKRPHTFGLRLIRSILRLSRLIMVRIQYMLLYVIKLG